MKKFILFALAILLFVVLDLSAAEEGFPGREKYPDIPYIEIEQLHSILSQVVIIDTRSNYEYDTLRIKGAINIPVANDDFDQRIKDIYDRYQKSLVFYCNGHRCMKSYIAAKKAIAIGINNVKAYDAGIFDWTKRYPRQAELLGQSPVDPKHLIAQKHFHSRLLHPDKFSEHIADSQSQSIVIDVRDKYQRAGIGFYPGLERWASLDDKNKLNRFIEKAKREHKTLYIYDEVGKQVQWLQYALEKAGLKNYYFMEHGARAYYDMLAKAEWQKTM